MRNLIPTLALAAALAACSEAPAQRFGDPVERARSAASVQIEACYVAEGTAEAARACTTAAHTLRRTKCWADMDARSRGQRSPIWCDPQYLDDL